MSIPATYSPDPALTEYIISYGILELADGVTVSLVSPPLGLSGFIFQLHDAATSSKAMINDTNLVGYKYSVTGQVTSTVTGFNSGKIKTLMVFFHPLGMYQLFG